MKTTEELENEIITVVDVNDFLQNNEENFIDISLADYLEKMMDKYDTKKSEILRRAELIGNTYGYELFQKQNKKRFSRDIILRVCVGFPLTLEETQMALRLSKTAELYARNKRDSLIMLGIHRKYSLSEIDALLIEHGEKVFVTENE